MKYTLKELRARKNWTQREAAAALGISTNTYTAWERDFGKVKARKAAQVADMYGVKVDDIFFEA